MIPTSPATEKKQLENKEPWYYLMIFIYKYDFLTLYNPQWPQPAVLHFPVMTTDGHSDLWHDLHFSLGTSLLILILQLLINVKKIYTSVHPFMINAPWHSLCYLPDTKMNVRQDFCLTVCYGAFEKWVCLVMCFHSYFNWFTEPLATFAEQTGGLFLIFTEIMSK